MKYKVGGRVVYRANETGNTELNGEVGTVIGIDSTEAPYTVRFDNSIYGMGTDERFYKVGQPRGHDWFCKEEHLSPVGVRRPVRNTEGVKKTAKYAKKEKVS